MTLKDKALSAYEASYEKRVIIDKLNAVRAGIGFIFGEEHRDIIIRKIITPNWEYAFEIESLVFYCHVEVSFPMGTKTLYTPSFGVGTGLGIQSFTDLSGLGQILSGD